MVTKNCGEALKPLRHKRWPKLLWVDSVCINQDDFWERSELVGKMNIVYGKAHRVAIYIGPGSTTTSAGLDVLRLLSNPKTKSLAMDQIASVEKLFKVPWFNRTWVIQEICLAKKPCSTTTGYACLGKKSF